MRRIKKSHIVKAGFLSEDGFNFILAETRQLEKVRRNSQMYLSYEEGGDVLMNWNFYKTFCDVRDGLISDFDKRALSYVKEEYQKPEGQVSVTEIEKELKQPKGSLFVHLEEIGWCTGVSRRSRRVLPEAETKRLMVEFDHYEKSSGEMVRRVALTDYGAQVVRDMGLCLPPVRRR